VLLMERSPCVTPSTSGLLIRRLFRDCASMKYLAIKMAVQSRGRQALPNPGIKQFSYLLAAAAAIMAATIVATGVAAQTADWSASGRAGNAGVRAMSADGTVELSGGCNALSGPGFHVTLHHYGGTALQRIDNRSEPVFFEVSFRDGSSQRFRAPMHYYEPEEAYVLSEKLPVAFLDAFARGDNLTIRNVAGVSVADWELTGTAAARRVMRNLCGF
jgi:hypothetical protein